MLGEDIKFINIDINEEKLSKTPKSIYKKEIRALINKAAFKYFMKLNKKTLKTRQSHIHTSQALTLPLIFKYNKQI